LNVKRTKKDFISGLTIKATSIKLPAVNLGALQDEYLTAKRDLKSKLTIAARANDAVDDAKIKAASARDKLAAASRAVMAEV